MLRARSPRMMRATELASRFGVTTRTIERDLLALQETGVPLWAQPGPGGGYGLHAEATLPPLNLTPTEAAAVATALAATRAMPFALAGQSVLAKLTSVMSAAPKNTASALVSRIRVVQGPGGALVDTVTDVIQRALIQSVAVDLVYRDIQDRETHRVIEPAGLVGTGHGWYLLAWCRLRDATRAFRIERIVRLDLLDGESIQLRPLDDMLTEIPLELVEPALV